MLYNVSYVKMCLLFITSRQSNLRDCIYFITASFCLKQLQFFIYIMMDSLQPKKYCATDILVLVLVCMRSLLKRCTFYVIETSQLLIASLWYKKLVPYFFQNLKEKNYQFTFFATLYDKYELDVHSCVVKNTENIVEKGYETLTFVLAAAKISSRGK